MVTSIDQNALEKLGSAAARASGLLMSTALDASRDFIVAQLEAILAECESFARAPGKLRMNWQPSELAEVINPVK